MQEEAEFAEPKNKWDINTILKLSIAVAILLIGLSIAYYFVIYIPSKEQNKENAISLQRSVNRLDYTTCVEEVQKVYHERWEGYCKANNLGQNCSIPVIIANQLEDLLRKDKEECRKVHLER